MVLTCDRGPVGAAGPDRGHGDLVKSGPAGGILLRMAERAGVPEWLMVISGIDDADVRRPCSAAALIGAGICNRTRPGRG